MTFNRLNRLMGFRLLLLAVMLLVFLLITACSVVTPAVVEPTPAFNTVPVTMASSALQSTPSFTTTTLPTPIPSHTPKPTSMGPVCTSADCLLLKMPNRSSGALVLIDPETDQVTELGLPRDVYMGDLASALSPDRKYLIVNKTKDAETELIQVIDYRNQLILNQIEIHSKETVNYASLHWNLSLEVKDELITRGLGSTALESAYRNSLGQAWWSANSKSLLYVDAGEDGYTHLFSYDLSTGAKVQLENHDLFIESLQASPDGSTYLIRKGVNPAFASPTLTRFYILNSQNQVREVPFKPYGLVTYLKAQWRNASQFWILSYNYAASYYNMLTLVDLKEDTLTRVRQNPFNYWIDYGDTMVFLQVDNDLSKLTVDLNTETIREYQIFAQCRNLNPIDDGIYKAIVECHSKSKPLYGLTTDWELRDDLDTGYVMNFSPNRVWSIRILSSVQKTTLTFTHAESGKEWDLEVPGLRHTFWSPDANWFFFVSPYGLHKVDLETGQVKLVLGNLPLDYPNLEAIWVPKESQN